MPAAGQAGERRRARRPFSHRTRRRGAGINEAEPVDVLVIGGGITGRESPATRRSGLSHRSGGQGRPRRRHLVALLRSSTAGSVISSKANFAGVRGEPRASCAARHRPAFGASLPSCSVYRGARSPPGSCAQGCGCTICWPPSTTEDASLAGRKPPASRARAADKELKGAALYYDAQTDDARLVIATCAARARGRPGRELRRRPRRSYKPDGRVVGATVRDELTGARRLYGPRGRERDGSVGDRVAAGLDDAVGAAARPTKGVHVRARKRVGHTHASPSVSPIDGRVMFVLPWAI